MPVQPATVDVYGKQGAQTPEYDAMKNVDVNAFLELMIAELQNQDPLDPMDNAQMLQQIGQIREIASNDRLSESLDAMLLGQNVATATSLVGQWVAGLSDEGEMVMGTVERAYIEDGEAVLHVVQRIKEYTDPTTGETTPEQVDEYNVALKNVSYVMRDDVDQKQLVEQITAADGLIGRSIVGVTKSGQVVTGRVEQIEIADGAVELVVGSHRIALADLTHVVDEETTTEDETTTSTDDETTTTTE